MTNSLIIDPTKYPRNDPEIVYGKTKPAINKKGLRKYQKLQSNFGILGADPKQTSACLKKVYQQYEEIIRWIKIMAIKSGFILTKEQTT